ncbi:M28 family metallopeptidase [Janibacter melonis]|uniref:M28 family metallopeptidase n=1 Tax=Janibacter melonis TaxID=262209 RepID=UPI001E3DED59|nr:M28 family metallopeptidase [Janibacter melonis]MCB5991134.1 M28 family metallopeptidase [Janibacter melonis]
MRSARQAAVTAAAATAALAVSSFAASPAQGAANPNNSAKMRQAVTVDGVMRHLQAFQDIADANGGNRGAGTSGYEASGRYVEQKLRAAGWTTERQYFPFVYEQTRSTSLTELSPDARTVENIPMSYSQPTPVGGVTGQLAAPSVATGCVVGDYAGADLTGKIAVVSRGAGCSFAQKAQVAKSVNASAIIIYNNTTGALNGTLGGIDPTTAPATGVTQAEGQAILAKMARGPVTMRFVLDKTIEERQTFNVIAETPTGRDDNVVMMGAHLDSVEDGPGINDNGSGTAGVLETAIQLGKVNKLNNKVRVAFWGAEELGLLGSTEYVADLQENDPAELKNIATYLNFDMIGSPNYIIGVYDADQSTYPAPGVVPPGSIETEDVLTDYFDSVRQPWVDTEFSGRSDYKAFIDAGIPASGLFTGADGTKTPAEVEKFGGTAGVIYDPNYHTPADDITNVNRRALDIMSDAIAHSAITLAQSTEKINGKRSNGKSGKPAKPAPSVLPEGRTAA